MSSETKNSLVYQVRIDSCNIFNTPRLEKVGIVHHQSYSLMLVIISHTYFNSYLNVEVFEDFAPIIS